MLPIKMKLQYFIVVDVVTHISKLKDVAEMTKKSSQGKCAGNEVDFFFSKLTFKSVKHCIGIGALIKTRQLP